MPEEKQGEKGLQIEVITDVVFDPTTRKLTVKKRSIRLPAGAKIGEETHGLLNLPDATAS